MCTVWTVKMCCDLVDSMFTSSYVQMFVIILYLEYMYHIHLFSYPLELHLTLWLSGEMSTVPSVLKQLTEWTMFVTQLCHLSLVHRIRTYIRHHTQSKLEYKTYDVAL